MQLQLRAAGRAVPRASAARRLVAQPRRGGACKAVDSLLDQVVAATGLSPAYLAAGASVLGGVLAYAAMELTKDKPEDDGNASGAETDAGPQAAAAPVKPPPPRENAVLVLGATGRLGRRLVKQLLASGRTVVAACRSSAKAGEVLLGSGEGAMGLKEGRQRDKRGILFIEEVDITSPESLKRPELWKGVSQVALTVGTVFGPLPEGGFGVIGGMSSEVVEGQGIPLLTSLLADVLPNKQQLSSKLVVPMRTAEEIAVWQKLDDVIMGGNSDSGMEPLPEGAGVQGAAWKGNLIIEGGGFCGSRTAKLDLDLGAYDGVHMRVKGDGQTFKMNIKTIDQEDVPESTYQTTFDTVAGQWADVFLPWHNFVAVKRAQSDPAGEPLDASRISKLGLVLSRFEFNKAPNPDYKPGAFELQIQGGINAYTAPRPQLVMVSSAGVERNAIIGDDEVARATDIPIVQLNPGGTLNHKYVAEQAVRASGYPYSVVRCTGMIDSNEGGPFLLDADQGDVISGMISRDEAAALMAAALNSPEAVGKTFEVRRNEGPESKGKRSMASRDYLRLFLKLAQDKHRWRVGLQPMPKAVPPPPPVTEERRKEIVAQVAVIRGQAPPRDPASEGNNVKADMAQAAKDKAEKAKAEKAKEPVGASA